VHTPLFAPHWARHHDNISIALSVKYELRQMLVQQRIYRVNSVPRRLGVAPPDAAGLFPLARSLEGRWRQWRLCRL
jgi:hypothetical protein